MPACCDLKAKFLPGLALAAGAFAGINAMYFFDPERGRRRRALARDKTFHLLRDSERTFDRGVRDFANRVQGALCQAVGVMVPRAIPDEILVERVRTRLGRLLTHPGSVEVRAEQGRITLTGVALIHEMPRLMLAIRCIPGVVSVENRIAAYNRANHVQNLQGRHRVPANEFELLRDRWTPSTRFALGTAGAAIALYGLQRRDFAGLLCAFAGGSLVARTAINRPLGEVTGLQRTAPGFTLQKTALLHAPIEKVFSILANPEKFPRIMNHVQQVRKVGEGRYRWTVVGPAGVTLSWESQIVRLVPNSLIEWASLPGSTVRNSGIVHFQKMEDGVTRIQLQANYMPPGGALGQFLSELLHADPKQVIDEDLVRLQSLIERGVTTAHHRKLSIEELSPQGTA